MRRNVLYRPAVIANAPPNPIFRVQAVQQSRQRKQIRDPKGRAASRNHDERILGLSAGPRRRKGTHHPVRIDVINPFYPPAQPALKKLELTAMQGMEWMRHPKGSTLRLRIECS